ncbi:hypothetical protein [Bacillus sp. E214]|uniref:hypothetical protein n=1 Tax=Bacillus sp. E214 TaxID=2587156 RepID=UPI0011E0428A|nr:hypothetical protein [Bacillus sp. E214]
MGLTTQQFALAVSEVAHEFSVNFIDLFGTSGINQFNRSLYISDTVHPKDLGKVKVANAIINGINKVF